MQVTDTVKVRVATDPCTFPAKLTFTSEDPLSISVAFHPDADPSAEPIEWVIGLELFLQAFEHGHSGHVSGDVIMILEGKELRVALRSPHGNTVIVFPKTKTKFFTTTVSHYVSPQDLQAAIDTLCDQLLVQ